jgi:hypothetical protein
MVPRLTALWLDINQHNRRHSDPALNTQCEQEKAKDMATIAL